MLNINDIKLLNELLEEYDVDYKYQSLKKKIGFVCNQIEIQEKAQKEMAEIQDKIVELDKVDENETEEE